MSYHSFLVFLIADFGKPSLTRERETCTAARLISALDIMQADLSSQIGHTLAIGVFGYKPLNRLHHTLSVFNHDVALH